MLLDARIPLFQCHVIAYWKKDTKKHKYNLKSGQRDVLDSLMQSMIDRFEHNGYFYLDTVAKTNILTLDVPDTADSPKKSGRACPSRRLYCRPL